MIGLDKIDNAILKLLSEESLHSSEISRRIKVLRTTVQYRLNRLSGLGLVKKTIYGRKSIWKMIYKNKHNKNYYRIYKGNDIVQAYRQLLNLPQNTLILVVQGSEAAKSELDNLPLLFIKEAHSVFKKKKIIMRGISNKKSLELFDKLEKDMIESHIGRPQGLKIFSNDKFLTAGEIMSTEKLLLFANPKLQTAVIIKDREMTQVIHDILRLIFELLDNDKTFDLNNYLKIKITQ